MMRKKLPFPLTIVLTIIFMGAFLILTFYHYKPVDSLTRDIASALPTPPGTAGVEAPGLDELKGYLLNQKGKNFSKVFRFRELSFHPRSIDLLDGTEELDYLAKLLIQYPKVKARIEAYIENLGDEEENLLLSENRAMIVREELIGRGVEHSRLRAEGRGVIDKRGQIEIIIYKP